MSIAGIQHAHFDFKLSAFKPVHEFVIWFCKVDRLLMERLFMLIANGPVS